MKTITLKNIANDGWVQTIASVAMVMCVQKTLVSRRFKKRPSPQKITIVQVYLHHTEKMQTVRPKKCNFRYYIMLVKISISVRLRRVGYIYEKITVWLIWNIVSAKVPTTTELSSDKASKIPQSLHNFFSRSHFSRQENIVSSVLKWHECASFWGFGDVLPDVSLSEHE